MKPTELMLGDWVMFNNPLKVQHIYNNGDDDVVAEIIEEGINDEGEYEEIRYVPSTYCSPIPLTPEILEKNEWKSDNNISECLGIEVFASEKNKCCVEFDGEDEYSFNTYERWEDTDYYGTPMDWGYRYITSIYHLRYVHELQHALRLCGLDELADNFKL